MSALDYDVLVLGGGSAGTSAAKAAATAGARTGMINDGELGGLCVLRGCMPTKSMLAAAEVVHSSEHTEPFGVSLEGRVVPHFARIMQRKNEHVARFARAKVAAIERQDYDVIDARGRFAAGGGIDVGGRVLHARRYVIASGSHSLRLPIPGLDDVPVIDSDDVMRLTEQPERLLVQGAGPIGLELTQFFARIGTTVTLVNRSKLCARYDEEIGEEMRRALAAEPRLDLRLPGRILELRPDGAGLVARIEYGEDVFAVTADALLMAVGRHAALDDLGLEHVGLAPISGRLEHDATMRTSNPDIFVAGDATGTHQILHIANDEGTVAGRNAAGGESTAKMDYRIAMQVAFTDPPFAQVGESEEEARDRCREIVVGRARFPETGRAITMGTRFGLWKLIVDKRTREIVGASILGPRADDLAHLIAILMYHHDTVDTILELPWYHPTLSEVMLDVARDARRQLA